MCHLPWQPPTWDRLSHRKHRKSNKKLWERSVTTAITAEADETSQFDPNLTDDEIAAMELAAVQGRGTSIQNRCHKRTYYLDTGRIVGASKGEQTRYLFVEYVNSGSVHGWPITSAQVDEKMRRARKDETR